MIDQYLVFIIFPVVILILDGFSIYLGIKRFRTGNNLTGLFFLILGAIPVLFILWVIGFVLSFT